MTKETEGTPAAPDFSKLEQTLSGLASGLASQAKSHETILEHLGKLSAPAPAAKKDDAPKALTAEDVGKAINDALAARDASASKKEARSRFIADKLKDVPDVYHSLLPDTDDAAALATGEQAVRSRFKADLARAGVKPVDVGGTSPGGEPLPTGADISKMSARDKILLGLNQSKPAHAAPPETTV